MDAFQKKVDGYTYTMAMGHYQCHGHNLLQNARTGESSQRMHTPPGVIHHRLRLRLGSHRRQQLGEYMLAFLCGLLQGLHLQTGRLAPNEPRYNLCMYER